MTVGSAVMAMDLADLPVVVFRHAGHGGINVVYRRTRRPYRLDRPVAQGEKRNRQGR